MRYDSLGWEQIFHEILIARNKKLRCRDEEKLLVFLVFWGFFVLFFFSLEKFSDSLEWQNRQLHQLEGNINRLFLSN